MGVGKRERNDIIELIRRHKKEKGTFRNFGGLVEYLENLLGRSVDVLTPMCIESIRSDDIKKSIKQGIVYV